MGFNIVIPLKIYPFDLMISIDQTYKEFEKCLKKKLPVDIHHEITHFKTEDYEAHALMFSSGQLCIRFFKTDPWVVSHEVFHAVDFLMRRIGVKLTRQNGESYAYLIEYITKKIYKKCSSYLNP